MAALCAFSSVTLKSYRIEEEKSNGAYSYEVTVACRTGTFSDITSLEALRGHIGITTMASGKTRIQTVGGTKASLVLNSVTHTNCYIADLTHREVPNALPFERWEYTVKFVQETI
jgi:hypothetical protein